MLVNILRLLVRIAGWLLTPIAAMVAAAVGATLGAFLAPRLSTTGGLIVTAVGGIIGASIGVWLWLRLIRRSPQLQAALAMTPEGSPTDEAVDELIGSDDAPVDKATS